MCHGDDAERLDPLPFAAVPRAEVMDELCDAVLLGTPPLHSGEWGLASTEVCLAILRSAAESRELIMVEQSGLS